MLKIYNIRQSAGGGAMQTHRLVGPTSEPPRLNLRSNESFKNFFGVKYNIWLSSFYLLYLILLIFWSQLLIINLKINMASSSEKSTITLAGCMNTANSSFINVVLHFILHKLGPDK